MLPPAEFSSFEEYVDALRRAACKCHPWDLSLFKGAIPWDKIDWVEFLGACVDVLNGGGANENGLADLLDHALQEGRVEIFQARGLDVGIGGDHPMSLRYPDPLATIIIGEHDSLLRRYLDAGLDPLAVHHSNGREDCNAMEFAERAASDSAVAMMRAHLSRNLIEGILDRATKAPRNPAA